jgi:hypothetical protein
MATMEARPEATRWYDRLLSVDRRWIYLILAIAVLLPTVIPFSVPTGISNEVRIHLIEGSSPGQPLHRHRLTRPWRSFTRMTEAILRQAFQQGRGS